MCEQRFLDVAIEWTNTQLESVRQFRFRLLNTDRDEAIIQVAVVHKTESTVNFS